MDWACGTGVASRSFLKTFTPKSLTLFDQSKMAIDFSLDKIKSEFPDVQVQRWNGSKWDKPYVLLVSHVLNELSANEVRNIFLPLLTKAHFFIWLEPGTSWHSGKIVEMREDNIGVLETLAPCSHQANCGMKSEANSRNWCHHFAKVPQNVFGSSFWAEFGKKMKIDLRSLPVSYWVGVQKGHVKLKSNGARVIGHPRFYKGYVQPLICDANGVRESKILKRDNKEIYALLESDGFDIFI